MKPKLRVSCSIAPFRERAEKALGLERYDYKVDEYDTPVVFLGLYHKGDYDSFRRPRTKRYVLWSGGDIQNLKRGYLYGDGKGLWKSKIARFFSWQRKVIKTKAEHFCENKQQEGDLAQLGIKASVVPAFWGNTSDFPVSFRPDKVFKVYICGHPGREEEYGFKEAKKMAHMFSKIEFHFYGAEVEADRDNIINHGIVSEEQFNKEIKDYHCLLRLNKHDGFSDILSKSILMGQYAISKVKHEWVLDYDDDNDLKRLINWARKQKSPYLEPREYYIKHFNNYTFGKIK